MYYSPNKIRLVKSKRMRWVWHVVCMGEMKNAYILGGKSEGNIALRRQRYRSGGYY
jgi:hypothetical protein